MLWPALARRRSNFEQLRNRPLRPFIDLLYTVRAYTRRRGRGIGGSVVNRGPLASYLSTATVDSGRMICTCGFWFLVVAVY